MADQSNKPSIRFAGFTDPWEQRKLGDCGVFRRGERFTAADYTEEGIPCIHYGQIYTSYGEIASEVFSHLRPEMADTLRYAHPGELVIAATSENVEDVCKAVAWLGCYDVAIHDDSYAFAHNGDSVFYSNLFRTSRFYEQKAQVAYGVKVMRVSSASLENMVVAVPRLSEQQAIGSFFSHLDKLITLHQRKYDKLVVFKKAMLEQMFPQEGETVPKIRFAGFTDPWEQRKLGELVSIGAGAPPSSFAEGMCPYVKVDDLNHSSHVQLATAQRVLSLNPAIKMIDRGSIVFAKRGAAILGNKVRILGMPAYIDTNMMALEPCGVDGDFLWLFINQTGLYRIADTSTIPQINNKHIEPYPVVLPTLAEQQAIGSFFSRLDSLITLHQRKLELLRNIKKSLLDEMFV